MKTMLELTKQLTELTSTSKPNEENEEKKVQVEKQAMQPKPSEILVESDSSGTVTKRKVESKVMEKPGTLLSRGTFVVGGSPVGWNFLLYPGAKLVYYGRTKESVLASRASKLEGK